MEILVCIGSSCHLKKSREVINELNKLINEKNLNKEIILKGSFCMENCAGNGVSVRIGDKIFSLKPENVGDFFNKEVIGGIDI